ncbi:MAG: DUF3488 and transglutaminase-like domain-containing protein, partial [Pseudomonadota bacterium]
GLRPGPPRRRSRRAGPRRLMRRWLSNPLLWVLATLLVALMPQLATMSPPLVAMALTPIAWRTLSELRGWKPLPTLLRLALTLGALVVLVSTYGNLLGRRAAVGLLSIMLALKLLETFRIRDARVVVSLSLFLCATQFLFSQGLVMIAYGAATMALALVALALIARTESFAANHRSPPPGRGMLAELTFGSRLMMLAIPLGLALFFFFPRWGTPLWGIPERSLDARSGLSDSMTPGSIQALFMDDSPAFRATFEGPVPGNESLYWRGPVMWDFDGREWKAERWRERLPVERLPEASDVDFRYEVQLEPHERRWLFALDYPVSKPPEAHLITEDFQLVTRRSVTGLMTYSVASDADFVDSPELKRTYRQQALHLEEGFNPRTLSMMADWRAEAATDAALVRRALSFFNQEPFQYTLNPPLLTGDSVDEFLFETRSGFCEHYASAFAIMMRAAGIPARIVTGYQGGWHNERENYVLVRQSDAHAWTEVWLPGVGWTRIDPTAAVAPSRVERGAMDALETRRHMLDFAWLREVRNGLDWVNRAWNDWVIAFDAARQTRLLSAFGIEQIGTRGLVLLLALAMLLGALVTIPWLLRHGRNREADPVVKAWRRVLERLSARGLPVAPTMGPMEVAASAASVPGFDARPVDALARSYLRLRYASDEADKSALLRALKRYRPGKPDTTTAIEEP